MHIPRMGAATRAYVLVTVVIVTASVLVSWFYLRQEYESMLQEQEIRLLQIAGELERRLVNEWLDDKVRTIDAMPLSQDEKAVMLNLQLQPIIMDVSKKYPHIGMGIYSKQIERIIAIAPICDPAMLIQVKRPEYLSVYETLTPLFTRVNSSIGFYGKPIVNVTYPIMAWGGIIGHTWASQPTEQTDREILASLIKVAGFALLVLAAVLLVIRAIFTNLNNGLAQLAWQIRERNHSPASLAEFPELMPLLETMSQLEARVQSRTRELEESEEHFRTLVENCPYAILRLNCDTRCLYVNKSYEMMFGVASAKIVGKTWAERGITRLTHSQLALSFEQAVHSGLAQEYDSVVTNAWGQTLHVRTVLIPEKDDSGRVVSILAIIRDVTEQKQSEERFYTAFQMNPSMMAITSQQGEFIDVNRSFVDVVGIPREEIIGKSVDELHLWAVAAQKRKVFEQLALDGKVNNYEILYHGQMNETRSGILSVERLNLSDNQYYLAVIADFTDKKRLENEIAHLDRLNIVGEMAAGIAHEVRNPMTTVRGYLQMLQMKQEFAAYHGRFRLMIEELDRANSIISEFLSLAKNKQVEMKRGSLNAAIASILPLMQADAFRRGHQVFAELGEITEIEFDEKEIRQLLLNLVRNAFEAMGDSGEVLIRTYQSEDGITLAIEDTGPGIPESVMKRIGTPFVTTKENGTGLGLPVCYRIAERHGAKVLIETGSQGTTFMLLFPAT